MIGSAKTREQLEALFESGDQPTAQDFADLIASFLLVDGSDLPDPLPAISGEDLTDIAIPDPLPAVSGENLTGIDIQEWDQVLPAPNYATALSFTHAGDLTGTYIKDRRVRLTVDSAFEYSDVVSSVYASGADTTTVTIADAMSSNLLTAADVSVFTPLEAGGAISPLMIGSIGAQFRAHEAATPDMTVVVDAGRLQNGTTLTEVAQQATATITAPTTNPRIDRVVIDVATGVVSVIAGAEAASPVAPALTTEKIAISQVLLQTATVAISNEMITDERTLNPFPEGLTLTSPVINGAIGYGMVILDEPEELASSVTYSAWTSSSSFISATLSNAKAVKAIIRISLREIIASGTQASVQAYIRKGGSSLIANGENVIVDCMQKTSASASLDVRAVGETVINLDSNSDFEYYITATSAPASAVSVMLVGYYV